jgi:hypothetical protein
MSTPLNFTERLDEEDENLTPQELRNTSSAYLNTTSRKSANFLDLAPKPII